VLAWPFLFKDRGIAFSTKGDDPAKKQQGDKTIIPRREPKISINLLKGR
jgi:hypothetical protein